MWRHTCNVIDFSTGKVVLVEQGQKLFERDGVEDIMNFYKGLNEKKIEIVTAGCAYKVGIGSN